MDREHIARPGPEESNGDEPITIQEGLQLEHWWLHYCYEMRIDPEINVALLVGLCPLFQPGSSQDTLLKRYIDWQALKRVTSGQYNK